MKNMTCKELVNEKRQTHSEIKNLYDDVERVSKSTTADAATDIDMIGREIDALKKYVVEINREMKVKGCK